MSYELIDNIESKGAGRPTSARTEEIYRALLQAKAEGKRGVRVALEEDEVEAFHRFTHRARSAAKKAGVNVSVSRSVENGVGNIVIK